MNTRPGSASPSQPTRRFPKGPLIVIALILASMVGVYWLTRATPRPPPELPPLRELPIDAGEQQAPAAAPGAAAPK